MILMVVHAFASNSFLGLGPSERRALVIYAELFWEKKNSWAYFTKNYLGILLTSPPTTLFSKQVNPAHAHSIV